MKIRLARESDKEIIDGLCRKHGIPTPNYALCLVAEEGMGDILGAINGGQVNFIDNIVSNDPMATVRLFSTMEGALMNTGLQTTFVGTINDEAGNLLLKAGYEEIKGTRFFIKRG